MRPPLVTRRAADVPSEVLVEAWNRAYTGYLVDVRRDAAGLGEHVSSTSVDLERSLVRFDGDVPVALALLGVRSGPTGERGWVGGFGVAPSHRGRGLASPLAADLLDVAARSGVGGVGLEVLTPNVAARRAYERVGFTVGRRLLVLSGRLSRPSAAAARGGRVLDPTSSDAAADGVAALSRRDPQPWGREPHHVEVRSDDVVVVAGPGDEPTAVVIGRVVHPPTPSAGATVLTVLTAAADDSTSAAAVVGALARSFDGAMCHVVNEPEGTPLATAFRQAGLAEVLDQHEMYVDLSRRASASR